MIQQAGRRWMSSKVVSSFLIFVAVGVAAFASVAVQGFVFGINNHLFYLPIALNWASDPIFAGDHFIQSLKHFTSLFWIGVRQVVTDDNAESMFYALHLGIRAASLLALIFGARELGIRGWAPTILLSFWFGLVPGLRWETPIGAGEIFTVSLGHSALTIPLTLASLILAARHSYFWAFASLGLIANVNAFIAAWVGWALLGVLAGERDRPKDGITSALAGLLVAALVALPIAYWIYAVIGGDLMTGQERAQFLHEYFPVHSFIDGTPAERLLLFGGVAASSLVGFRQLAARPWFSATLALCILVVGGALLPKVLLSRFLLDLHLIRAASLVQLLGILGLTVASSAALAAPDPLRCIGGALALCFLALPTLQGMLLAAAVLLAANHDEWKMSDAVSALLVAIAIFTSSIWDNTFSVAIQSLLAVTFLSLRKYLTRMDAKPRAALAAVAVVLVCVAVWTYKVHKSLLSPPDWEDAREAANWTRRYMPADALILVPQTAHTEALNLFGSLSRRRIWVDWKRGGAAMWAPSYYNEWSNRMRETSRLPDLPSKMAYACAKGIDYVLIGPETESENSKLSSLPVYSNDRFRLFRSSDWCPR